MCWPEVVTVVYAAVGWFGEAGVARIYRIDDDFVFSVVNVFRSYN